MLHHDHCQVPVTALAQSENYLFAGKGPNLLVHSRDGSRLLSSLQVFQSQAIHGVLYDGTYGDVVFVWGGALVSLIKVESILQGQRHAIEVVIPPLACPDWILHAAFQPRGKNSSSNRSYCIALVTAHNALLTLTVNPESGGEIGLHEHTSQSKCILYSAHLQWVDHGKILLASGTVFGEIIVWSCVITSKVAHATLHYVLTGHDGSIFGVDISPYLYTSPEEPAVRLLASCSDDRTVRIWDISDLPETLMNPQTATDLSSARETGFGANTADFLDGNVGNGICVANGWGHASRIWSVTFVPSADASILSHLVTFGEDATCSFWTLNVANDNEAHRNYTLSDTGSLSLHAGKNIWSSSLFGSSENTLVINSGGADGSIARLEKDVPFVDPRASVRVWSIDDIVDGASKQNNEKLRSYSLLGVRDLLAVTASGRVWSYHSQDTARDCIDTERWYMVAQQDELRGYSVTTSIARSSTVFLSGQSGSVFVYHPDIGIHKLAQGQGKTATLFARSLYSTTSSEARVNLLVTTVEHDTVRLLDMGSDPSQLVSRVETTTLQLPQDFVVTSFAVRRSSRDTRNVVLGSRNGNMAVYTIRNDQEHSLPLKLSLLGSNNTEAITDLAWANHVEHGRQIEHIFASSRDGRFSVYEMEEADTVRLCLVHRTIVPGATSVERLVYDPSARSLLVCGFRSKHFVVFDMINERETMTIDCGGPNRTWVFEPSVDSSCGVLAWTKASQLCLQHKTGSVHSAVNGGGHGREIKAVAVSKPSAPLGQLIATGAEDTDIKIFRHQKDQDGTAQFRCLRTVKKHNTGIQHLEWSEDGSFLFSSGGFEELFVWRIRPVPVIEMGIVCESVCPTDSELPDLRIMSFSVTQKPSECNNSKINEFTISTVRSDSTVRVYSYTSTPTEKTWHCIHASNYLSSCLTHTINLPFTEHSMLVTSGTDGHIAFLDHASSSGESQAWNTRAQIHQNTVHCIDTHHLVDDSHLLFTGGDDNALSISRCSVSRSSSTTIDVKTLTIPRAHTAAVTGLVSIKIPDQPNKVWIATGSIDQRLKLWEVQVDVNKPGVEGVEVRRLQNVFTPVADVSSLALLQVDGEPAVIVCGVGMDIWKLGMD